MDKQRRWNLTILIILFLIVICRSFFSSTDVVVARIQDDALVIIGSNQLECQIPTDTIRNVELEENISYPQNPDSSSNVISGTFANDQWGEYVLCVYAENSSCIVVESTGGIYVFNYEDAQITSEVYLALQDALQT